jgi:hypothetical protein
VHWTPRAVPLGFVVLALQARWGTVQDEMRSNFNWAERGTGPDRNEGAFLPVCPRDHGAGLVALSFLPLSISVGLQTVPASHQMGLKNESK